MKIMPVRSLIDGQFIAVGILEACPSSNERQDHHPSASVEAAPRESGAANHTQRVATGERPAGVYAPVASRLSVGPPTVNDSGALRPSPGAPDSGESGG